MVQFTLQFPLLWLSESSFGENHLVVLVNLQAVRPAELRRQRFVQRQEPSQSVEREAAVAAVVSVAVYQQQISAARHQVTVQSTALQEVQLLSQTEQTHRVSLQKSSVDGEGERDGGGAAEPVRELHDVLHGRRRTWKRREKKEAKHEEMHSFSMNTN